MGLRGGSAFGCDELKEGTDNYTDEAEWIR